MTEDGPDDVRITCAELGGTGACRAHASSCARGATVWAAIRPEKISISRQPRRPRRPGENVVRGTVREIAYMGDMSIYLVQIESGQDAARDAAQHQRAAASARIAREESVWLSWHGSSPGRADRVGRQLCALSLRRAGRRLVAGIPDAVAAAAVPHSVHHRVQHLLLGGAPRDAAVHAAAQLAPRHADAAAALVGLLIPVHGLAVRQLLPVLAQGGGGLDAAAAC